MSHSVTFTYDPGGSGEDAVTVHGPTSPTEISEFAQFVSERTVDGTRYAYQLNDTDLDEWVLNLASLTTAQKNAFDTWWRDTIRGPNEPFSYTHTDGTTYTNCRAVDNTLAWSRVNNNEWNLTLRIEVPQAVNS